MKFLIAAAAGLALWSSATLAAQLPDYDAFYESQANRPVGDNLSGRARALVNMGQVLHSEERLGVPTVFFAGQDPNSPKLRALGLTSLQAARRYLFEYAELYRIAAPTLAESELENLHDLGRGAVIATFSRKVGGTSVFRDRIHVVMDQDLRLVAITGFLSPNNATRNGDRNLSRATAVSIAFADLTGEATIPEHFVETGRHNGPYRYLRQVSRNGENGAIFTEDARIKDVLYAMPDDLVPAYYVEISAGRASTREADYFGYVVSAVDGRVLFRHDQTAYDAFTYRVWAETSGDYRPYDGPDGTAGTPHPTGTPNGYMEPFVPQNLVTLANTPFSNSATDFWLDSTATETIGNNAEAYADHRWPDGFTAGYDVHGAVSSTRSFDYLYDVNNLNPKGTTDQIQAALAQLFYDVNFFHDWYYDNGFDESAGNAQLSNYGRAGLDGDSLKAEAQDESGLNNANMSTPADGARPRMQMYMWEDYFAPADIRVAVNSPAALAGNLAAGTASFGSGLYDFDYTGDVVYADDGTATPSIHDGCESFANPAPIAGKIALIDRGTCNFQTKVENAVQAGATGVIIVNNASGPPPGMGGSGFEPVVDIGVPILSISQADGSNIKTALTTGPVNVRMRREFKGRDGTIDNGVVAHEWGHYISNRLVSDAAGLFNNQGRSMGEGWADFHALLMIVREGDAQVASNANFTGTYTASTYAGRGQEPDIFYWGIRRYPYSVDMTKNPLTFGMIQNGVALPSGPTAPPVSFGQSGTTNAEVHSSGEVWCSALWETYVKLLQSSRYTFAQAQNQMKDYLIAGYKATPVAPTFLEARDALLAVTYANSMSDFQDFAAAFAKRGMGMGAVAPSRLSTTHFGTSESFLDGGDAQLATWFVNDNSVWCDHDGVLDNGETGLVSITLKNDGWKTLSNLAATVTSTTPGVTVGNNGQISFQTSQPYGVVTGTVPVSLTGATGQTVVTLNIELTDPTFVPGTHTATIEFRANWDESAAVSATDDVEAPTSPWTISYDPSLAGGELFERVEYAAQDHKWYGPNPNAPADIYLASPPLNVASSGNFVFTFQHRFSFEVSQGVPYDGGILEISSDGGQSWTQIPPSAITGQNYNRTLAAGGSNPLNGRTAFGGLSTGYPAMQVTTVDLGSQYQGQTVQVRFRIGSDDNTSGSGWEIDNIAFFGITNTPFHSVIADRGICVNRPPIAVAGPDQVVDERTQVTLDGSGSSDPDDDPLTLTWSQITGPSVTFTGTGIFVAPEVTADTELTFALIASDGTLVSPAATAKVTVRQVNRKPTAMVAPELTVNERELLTLDGSHSFDIDGDALATYKWTQLSGPSVTLSDSSAVSPTFTAPEVLADSVARFELVVSDGDLTSDPATVDVQIKQVNRAPAVSIADQGTIAERTELTLTATGIDPDEEDVPNLRFHWTQVAGPKATIDNPDQASITFNAPEVTADTDVTFTVEVTDGDASRADRLSADATVTFKVQQVNRAPMADAGQPRRIPSQAFVILGGDIEDPDGDAITISWKQIGGPEVKLNDITVANPRFRLPALTADTDFKFEVTVSDGMLSSTDNVVITGTPVASGCGCNAGDNGFTGMGALFAVGALALFARRRRAL